METANLTKIVDEINRIVAEWSEANLAAMDHIPPKFRRYALAGLERGAYIKAGKAAEYCRLALGLDEDASVEDVGKAAIAAVKQSNIAVVMSRLNINQ